MEGRRDFQNYLLKFVQEKRLETNDFKCVEAHQSGA